MPTPLFSFSSRTESFSAELEEGKAGISGSDSLQSAIFGPVKVSTTQSSETESQGWKSPNRSSCLSPTCNLSAGHGQWSDTSGVAPIFEKGCPCDH